MNKKSLIGDLSDVIMYIVYNATLPDTTSKCKLNIYDADTNFPLWHKKKCERVTTFAKANRTKPTIIIVYYLRCWSRNSQVFTLEFNYNIDKDIVTT